MPRDWVCVIRRKDRVWPPNVRNISPVQKEGPLEKDSREGGHCIQWVSTTLKKTAWEPNRNLKYPVTNLFVSVSRGGLVVSECEESMVGRLVVQLKNTQ